MKRTEFALIGAGWRAEFFLRVAQALPEKFCVGGIVEPDVRNASAMKEKWNVDVFPNIDAMLAAVKPEFLVICVPHAVTQAVLTEAAATNIPVLMETPPAINIEGLIELNKTLADKRVQVSEQYIFQPFHAAILNFLRTGKLGDVSHAQVSIAHGYHGISLLRHILGVGFDGCRIRARNFSSPIIDGPDRDGPPSEERINTGSQTIAWLDFGEKLGVYDFSGDQYFSWIRGQRLLIQGLRGEIDGLTFRYLLDHVTPIEGEFHRRDTGAYGNLEGLYHEGFIAAGEWMYRNPFIPARLTDDEIAVATCLSKMTAYAQGGESFYSLAEASQDTYLALLVDQAVASGEEITATPQPWARFA